MSGPYEDCVDEKPQRKMTLLERLENKRDDLIERLCRVSESIATLQANPDFEKFITKVRDLHI